MSSQSHMSPSSAVIPLNALKVKPILNTMRLFFQPRFLQLVMDIIAFATGFIIYIPLRAYVYGESVERFDVDAYLLVTIIVSGYWVILFWLGGMYRDYYIRSPFEEGFAVVKHLIIGSILMYMVIYMSSSDYYQSNPRFIIMLYGAIMIVTVVCGRIIARLIQGVLRRKGIVTLPTVLFGNRVRLVKLVDAIEQSLHWGHRIIGIVPTDTDDGQGIISYPVLGTATDLVAILEMYRPSDVLVSIQHPDHSELLTLAAHCTSAGCRVKIVPDLYEIFTGQARTHQVYGTPLIEVSSRLQQPWEVALKRLMDVFVSGTTIVLGLPVWLVTAIAVKLSSKGPAFYIQERVGKNGRVFKMYKFRSMYVEQESKPSWTRQNDPRVTPVGWFLRKSHLDEFPQMWNVLLGEMSLVGPRPEQPFFVDEFSRIIPYYTRRLAVRPGLTGWWQVKSSAADNTIEKLESRLQYDFYYIENMSFRLDLEIIVRTIFVMLTGHGKA